jgi:serine/threonine protein kinase
MKNRVGQQLGNYHIVQLLGQGGFAEVYLGEHIYLKTRAAIKVLQARLSSSADTDSFLKEAQTIAHLSHPHIVRVMDFGITEEIPYLVMDYAPNGTLRQRHPKDTLLPLTTIITYVKQLADALQYAHDEKLIHRDIKPENMLLGRRNEVLLSDFGIALIAQSSRYQSTQDVIGTVAYMSPEQIQGKSRTASDQYSLGIVVYEWLCGDRPFRGSFTELCTQHIFTTPPPLCEKAAEVSPYVEQVVMTALAKEPKQRFTNIQEFAHALEQASRAQHLPPTILSSGPLSSPFTAPVQSADLRSHSSAPLAQPVESPLMQTSPPRNISLASPHSRVLREPLAQALAPTINIWRIGISQIGTTALGIVLLTGVFALLGSYNSHEFDMIILFLLALIKVLPLFFGAIAGPWVGLLLLTGGIGSFAFVSLLFGWWYSDWSPGILSILAISLSGFIVGITLLKTRGNFSSFRSIAYVESIAALVSIIIFFIFISLGASIFASIGITLLSLLLLPILLFMYGRIARKS